MVAYGALLPAGRARHPGARLGQPALLAAARLARRRAGAARGAGGRRGHRGHHLPDRGRAWTPARCTAMVTERSGPTDTSGDLLARLALAGARPAGGDPGRDRGRHAACRPQPAEGITLAPEDQCRGRPIDWTAPGAADRPAGPRLRPAPGAWTTFRGERLKIDSAAWSRTVRSWLAGRAGVDQERSCPGRHRQPRRGARRGQAQGKKPMPAADWARGRISDETAGDCAAAARAPAAAEASRTAARRLAFDALRAVNARRRVRQPRPRPRCSASAGSARARRGARRPSWCTAPAPPGHATTRSSSVPPAAQLELASPAVLDVLRLGAHQLLGHAGADPRRRLRERRTGRGDVGDGSREVGQRRAAPGRRARPDGWLARVAAVRPMIPRTTSRVAHSHPRWIVAGATPRLLPRRRLEPRCWRPTTSSPRSPWWPGPAARGRGAARGRRDRRAALAVRRPVGGNPAASTRSREGRAGVQDEGSQLVALALARRRSRRPGRGWTSAPGPAARPRCSPGWPPGGGGCCSPRRMQPHRARLVAKRAPGQPGRDRG